MAKKEYTNRLIHEKSPYLLQHAHNPVNWYAWNEEAFNAAKEENKPIFLSIGYATCHWCHVMEKESFQNDAIAKLLNESFINVKVDREELPQIDSLYMEFAQAIIPGGGGWPLNVLLTPELKPFFATSYLPPKSEKGLIGLSELLSKLKELWENSEERDKLNDQASHIIEIFAKTEHVQGTILPPPEIISQTAEMLYQIADPTYGGIKGEPKFPMGYHCSFLLRIAKVTGDSRALFYVDTTLEMLRRGGIYDHLGGGFSRYSVDSQWMVPHFEKMLYDNAILARVYLEGWLFTKNPIYKETCESILNYILRDLSHPEGGFYSAEDSDSDGKEGLFYTWTPNEIKEVLGEEDSLLFCEYYDVTSHGVLDKRSILHIRTKLEEFAHKKQMPQEQLSERLETMCTKLWEAREKRPHPFKDKKILVGWNALTISSLIQAGRSFDEPIYTEAAKKAISFIQKNLWKDEHLLRRWCEGESKFNAGLDEYAFMIHALLNLFEAEGGLQFLSWAMGLTDLLREEFKLEDGAYYLTDGKDPYLVMRQSDFYDGAEPSGNGVHCENLLRLYQITLDETYLRHAEDILKALLPHIEYHPIGCCYHLMAMQRYYDKHASTVVVALNSQETHKKEINALLSTHFYPNHMVIWKKQNDTQLSKVLTYLEDLNPIKDQTTVYICHKGQCKKPLTDWPEIVTELTHL